MQPGWKSHENLPEFVNEMVEKFLSILDLFNQGLYKRALIVYFILIMVLFFFFFFFEASWNQFVFVGEAVVIGYLLHFITFFPMERTLFIHHYLPALFFKIVLLPVLMEHVHRNVLK